MSDYFRLGLNLLDDDAYEADAKQAYEDRKEEYIAERVPELLNENSRIDIEYSFEDAQNEASEEFDEMERRAALDHESDLAESYREKEADYGNQDK